MDDGIAQGIGRAVSYRRVSRGGLRRTGIHALQSGFGRVSECSASVPGAEGQQRIAPAISALQGDSDIPPGGITAWVLRAAGGYPPGHVANLPGSQARNVSAPRFAHTQASRALAQAGGVAAPICVLPVHMGLSRTDLTLGGRLAPGRPLASDVTPCIWDKQEVRYPSSRLKAPAAARTHDSRRVAAHQHGTHGV